MKHIAHLLAAFCTLVPACLSAQTPFNANPPCPYPEIHINQKHDHISRSQYRAQGWDTVVTYTNPTIELSAEPYIPVRYFNGTYIVEEIPYNPPDTTFSLGARMSDIAEDLFCDSLVTIPFKFYFFGVRKTLFRVGENGLLSFYLGTNTTCCWNYSAPLPWPDGTTGAPGGSYEQTATMRDAVYGVFEDIRNTPGTHVPNWGIYYGIQDIWPRRKIICSWNDIAQYYCDSNHNSYQIVCYEGTNIIEVHVKQRHACPNWNGGRGIIGIQNATGQPQVNGPLGDPTHYVVNGSPAAFYPSNFNYSTAAVDHIAYRFTPQGSTNTQVTWYRIFDDGRDPVYLPYYNFNNTNAVNDTNGYCISMNSNNSEHPTLTKAVVRPTCVSRYVVEFKFQNADADWYTLRDTITVGIDTMHYQVLAPSSDSTMGITSGSGIYGNLSTATLYALPQQGNSFQGWSNGVGDNPYNFTVVSDTTVTALFSTCADTIYIHDTVYVPTDGIDGVDGVAAKIYTTNGCIVVESGDGALLPEVMVYDVMGRLLTQPATTGHIDGSRATFVVPSSGVYLVKIGNLPARRVVVIR